MVVRIPQASRATIAPGIHRDPQLCDPSALTTMPSRIVKSERPLKRDFFARDALSVARDLIGVVLLVDGVGGMIVEAEAYDPTDPASHSYEGRRTPRNESMFGPAGQSYVYRSYGVHWCLNFLFGGGGRALSRAPEPRFGGGALTV